MSSLGIFGVFLLVQAVISKRQHFLSHLCIESLSMFSGVNGSTEKQIPYY